METIVCGFISNKIESSKFMVKFLSYYVNFKQNFYCKLNQKSYINPCIKSRIKETFYI